MTTKTENIGELATALAKANMEIRNAELDRVNPHFKNRYATLGSILNAVRVPLAKHGLSTVQTVKMADGCVFVSTTLMHSSGQWMEESAAFPLPDKSTVQQMGSCITYLRRYTLAAICGIVGDEDDDGEGDATQRTASRPAPAPSRPAPAPSRPAPAPAAERKPAAEEPQADGEYVEIFCKYLDEGVGGKNQSPYLKVKTPSNEVYFCWNEALFPTILSCKNKTMWAIVEASVSPNGAPRIKQVRTSPPVTVGAGDADGVEIPF